MKNIRLFTIRETLIILPRYKGLQHKAATMGTSAPASGKKETAPNNNSDDVILSSSKITPSLGSEPPATTTTIIKVKE